MKYLGIIINGKLKWDDHVDYAKIDIARKIGFMYRSYKYVSKRHKWTIYSSIIEPYFVYSHTICLHLIILKWDFKYSRIKLRFILNKGCDTPVLETIESLDWLNVKQLITCHTLKFINKLRLGQLTSYLYERIQYNFEIHDYITRNRNNIKLPRMKTDLQRKSVFFEGFKR